LTKILFKPFSFFEFDEPTLASHAHYVAHFLSVVDLDCFLSNAHTAFLPQSKIRSSVCKSFYELKIHQLILKVNTHLKSQKKFFRNKDKKLVKFADLDRRYRQNFFTHHPIL